MQQTESESAELTQQQMQCLIRSNGRCIHHINSLAGRTQRLKPEREDVSPFAFLCLRTHADIKTYDNLTFS